MIISMDFRLWKEPWALDHRCLPVFVSCQHEPDPYGSFLRLPDVILTLLPFLPFGNKLLPLKTESWVT